MEPRTGAARMALASGAPVIPIGIHIQYRTRRLFRANHESKEKHGGWFARGPYFLTYGKPVTYQGDVEDRRRARKVSRLIMDNIIELAHTSKERMSRVMPIFPPQGIFFAGGKRRADIPLPLSGMQVNYILIEVSRDQLSGTAIDDQG